MNTNEFAQRYGPVALVTGASSGIGRAFAAQLAARGFDLVIVARRVPRLHELADGLRERHGVRVTVVEADLARADAAQVILDATAELDIGLLVSNAGFGFKGTFDAAEPQAISDMLMVNCHAPLRLARGFVPRLRRRGRGGIVFTSSVEGLIGCPYSAAYAASKAFVVSLGEALWAELAPDGIDVLTLCPGATYTEAPRLQGIDPATLQHLMAPDAVAALALDHLDDGPLHVPSEHYRASFERLLAMPRRDALRAMAVAMKPRPARIP
jgi:short-subunit dehydrogenase